MPQTPGWEDLDRRRGFASPRATTVTNAASPCSDDDAAADWFAPPDIEPARMLCVRFDLRGGSQHNAPVLFITLHAAIAQHGENGRIAHRQWAP
jgi:hypothetical protein